MSYSIHINLREHSFYGAIFENSHQFDVTWDSVNMSCTNLHCNSQRLEIQTKENSEMEW